MKKNYLEKMGLIAFGVVLYAVVMNLQSVAGAVSRVLGYFLPFIAGLLIAFVLDVPVRGFEKFLRKRVPRLRSRKTRTAIGVLFTFIAVGGVLAALIVVVAPVLADSVRTAYQSISEHIPGWIELLEKQNINTASLRAWLSTVNLNGIIDSLSNGAGNLLSGVIGVATDTITGIVTFATALIIAVYILLDRERVLRHAGKFIDAAFGEKAAREIRRVAGMIKDTYSRFMSGQCLEALIIGVLMFVILVLFRLPYAALTSVLAGVLSFIPYIGPFVACLVGAILSLLVSPGKFFLFLLAYLVAQVIEGQLIYPHVVGNSVGLSPLITLVSVLVGGSLFGLLGMIFFLPLVSVLYALGCEWIQSRASAKKRDS